MNKYAKHYKKICNSLDSIRLEILSLEKERDDLHIEWRKLQGSCLHKHTNNGFGYASCLDCGKFDV